MTQVTVKTGGLTGWHGIHIVLSILTGGIWLLVYAIHAAAAPRATWVTLDVPPGHEVVMRKGQPVVLAPGEMIERPWVPIIKIGAVVVVLGVAIGVLVASAL